MVDLFTVVAEPSRRRILDRLLVSEATVSDLIAVVGTSQPAMSKHLRVLRDSNLVTSRVDAQRRVYALNSEPLAEIDQWLGAYRSTWSARVDALAEHLDRVFPADGAPSHDNQEQPKGSS